MNEAIRLGSGIRKAGIVTFLVFILAASSATAALTSTPSWIAESNEDTTPIIFPNATPRPYFGDSVSSTDVNGDGYGDVIVSAPGRQSTFFGVAYVYMGSASGLSATPAWRLEARGAMAGPTGDVNGDGYGDVIVNSGNYYSSDAHSAVHVYMGSASGLSPTPAWTIGGETPIGGGPAGDVNGDGYGDVVVVDAYSYTKGVNSKAYVYMGSASGLSPTPAWTVEAPGFVADQTRRYDFRGASSGDFNGDGYDDVFLGDGGGANESGWFCVYMGSASGLSAVPAMTAEGLGPAGDVNNDGYDDLIARTFHWPSGDRILVYMGSASGLSQVPAQWLGPGEATQSFGRSIAAGDVNGDGYEDVLVGAPSFIMPPLVTEKGKVFLYLGSASGLSPAPAWVAESPGPGEDLGARVFITEDVNGDGYRDLLVGSPESGAQGRVFLYYGHSDIDVDGDGFYYGQTDCNERDAAIHPGAEEACNGVDDNCDGVIDDGLPTVSFYADRDGDSYGDEAAPIQACSAPRGYVADRTDCDDSDPTAYPGATETPGDGVDQDCNGIDAKKCLTDTDHDAYGSCDARTMVVALDGICDASRSEVEGGECDCDDADSAIHPGASETLGDGVDQDCHWDFGDATDPSMPAVVLESDKAQALFGRSVSSAGDVNGDGYDDVIVGTYEWFYRGHGEAFVYLGTASGLSKTPAWTARSDQECGVIGDSFGESVDSAGDVNGDGYGDVIVGAYSYQNGQPNEGAAFVFLGSATGLSTAPAWKAESDRDYANFGTSVAGAGDVNGDGYDDVIVVASDSSSSKVGVAYLYLGSASGLSPTPAWTASYPTLHSAVGAGDVNGDGYGDVIVGVPRYDNYVQNGDVIREGRVFLYLGSASGLSTVPDLTLRPDMTGLTDAQFGTETAPAGDVNGDGYDDVIVVQSAWDPEVVLERRILVFLGSAQGLTTAPAWAVGTHQIVKDSSNWSAASAGDVDADGYDDVIVGESRFNDGTTIRGRVFLYRGGPKGLSLAPVWTTQSDHLPENGWSDYFGASVDSAGDVNGDGFDDVIVGARLYSNGETLEGAAFLYMGAPLDADHDGYTGAQGDCDDGDPSIRPGAADTPDDGVDQDCNGSDTVTCYQDDDQDGYGSNSEVLAQDGSCDIGDSESGNATDCDDTNPSIHPGATEVYGDGVDQDCSGTADDGMTVDGSHPPANGDMGSAFGGSPDGGGCFMQALGL